MQAISVYLYPNKLDVYTNPSDTWTNERYRRVYNRNLKIYRGVDNRIDVQVRNADEKATDASNVTLVFNLVDRESQKLVVQKDCTPIAASSGRFYVTLSEAELLDVSVGSYQYSINKETRSLNNDGTYRVTNRSPLYSDGQYGTVGTIELYGSGSGDPVDSVKVTTFNLHDPGVYGVSAPRYYISSLIDARPKTTFPQTLHTFQIHFTNYDGTALIQGSIDDGGTPSHWVDLEVLTVDTTETNRYVNITGKWNWFRIKQNYVTGSNAQFVVQQTTLGNYIVHVDDGGSSYKVGQVLTVPGSQLGGVDGVNDLLITVTSINPSGSIPLVHGISYTGTSINGYKTFVIQGAGPLTAGSIDKVLYR